MHRPARSVRQVTLACALLAGAGHVAAQDPLTTRCESAPVAALCGPCTEPMLDRSERWPMIAQDIVLTNGLTEAKELLKGRPPGAPHPPVDPKGFREQLDALQEGAEQRLVVERAKKPN